MKGSKMAGEELFLENATSSPIGSPPMNSNVTQSSTLSKRDIASVFHVPPATHRRYGQPNIFELSRGAARALHGSGRAAARAVPRQLEPDDRARSWIRRCNSIKTPSTRSRRRARRRPSACISCGRRASSRRTRRSTDLKSTRSRAATCSTRRRTSCRSAIREGQNERSAAVHRRAGIGADLRGARDRAAARAAGHYRYRSRADREGFYTVIGDERLLEVSKIRRCASNSTGPPA